MTRDDLALLWRRHRAALVVFALAAAAVLFFAGRMAVSALYWANHRDEPAQPWMTVGYVAHSWGLDAREIDARAGLPPPEQGHPFTLQEIAAMQGVPVAEVVAKVEATVAALRAEGHE